MTPIQQIAAEQYGLAAYDVNIGAAAAIKTPHHAAPAMHYCRMGLPHVHIIVARAERDTQRYGFYYGDSSRSLPCP